MDGVSTASVTPPISDPQPLPENPPEDGAVKPPMPQASSASLIAVDCSKEFKVYRYHLTGLDAQAVYERFEVESELSRPADLIFETVKKSHELWCKKTESYKEYGKSRSSYECDFYFDASLGYGMPNAEAMHEGTVVYPTEDYKSEHLSYSYKNKLATTVISGEDARKIYFHMLAPEVLDRSSGLITRNDGSLMCRRDNKGIYSCELNYSLVNGELDFKKP
jgi:hypothetical protein